MKEEKPECVGKRRVGRKVMRVLAYVVLGIIVAALFALVFGFVLKWLWNWLMPDIFGLRQISYWQAFGLLIRPSSSSGGSATPIMTATTTCSRGASSTDMRTGSAGAGGGEHADPGVLKAGRKMSGKRPRARPKKGEKRGLRLRLAARGDGPG